LKRSCVILLIYDVHVDDNGLEVSISILYQRNYSREWYTSSAQCKL